MSTDQTRDEWYKEILALEEKHGCSVGSSWRMRPVITDEVLMEHLGFTSQHEQDLILAFMRERGFDTVKGLVAHSLRAQHALYHPAPEWDGPRGCPALD